MNIEPPSKEIPVAAATMICYTDSEQKAENASLIYGEAGMISHEQLKDMHYYLDQNSYELTDKLYGLKEMVLKPFIEEYLQKKYNDDSSRIEEIRANTHFKKIYHDGSSVNELLSNMDISALCYLIKDNKYLKGDDVNVVCRCIRTRNIEAHKGTENIKDICLVSAFYVIYTASKIMRGEGHPVTKKFYENYRLILAEKKNLAEDAKSDILCKDYIDAAMQILSEIKGFEKRGSNYYGLFDEIHDKYGDKNGEQNKDRIIDNMHYEVKEANDELQKEDDTDPHEALYLLFALYRLAYCLEEKRDTRMKADEIIRLYGQLFGSKILPQLQD